MTPTLNTPKLQDRVAIVTGAGGGFGEGIAHHFAQLGAQVVVADLRADAARSVAAAIREAGGQAVAVTMDVTQDRSWAGLLEATIGAFGRLDILVNNAGTTHKNQPMLDVDEASFDRLYATNVKSLYLSARHAVPAMRKIGGGVIVNIASTAAARPRPGLAWYSGTKGAVVTLTKAMAVELAPDRIRVNAINPVMGETGLLTEFLPGANDEATRARILATIPLGRFSRPLDIAMAAAFLSSDEAQFITGAALEVDGGRCI
jgi:3-oxoacyl-[acyl-carrier protein] reductase